MRLLYLWIFIAPLLTACGLQERFDSADGRINAALPPDSGVQAARQLLLAQTAGQPDAQKALTPLWEARLRLRALTCSRDYTPTWRHSQADIRARLTDTRCFAERDRDLQRWLGLQRVRLFLAQGPIRPVPPVLPAVISHREFISTLVAAREAPVAIVRGPSGFDVIELSSGRSLYSEAVAAGSQGLMDLSPNGRLFTHAVAGKVSVRATEGGETLIDLLQADGLLWLDDRVVILRSNAAAGLRLLDLASGEESPVPGTGNWYTALIARAPGAPNRFNLFTHRGVEQIEIVDVGGRREAQLRAEKRSASGRGFALSTGDATADGRTWIDGHQGLRVLDLDTLDLEERSFDPVGMQTAVPTPQAQEFLVAMHLPTGDRVTSQINYYLYNHRAGTLAAVQRESGSSTRYQYIRSIARLALIDNRSVQLLQTVPAAASQPVATVLAGFIDEMNQRRLAAAATPPSAMQGQAAGVAGGADPRPAAVMTPLQAQLRDAQVEGVGVYEGQGGKHGVGMSRLPGMVEVRVRRSSRPIALVLSSYEPVRWVIRTEPGARLEAVLLSGYYESTVVGNGAARVYQIGQGYAYEQQSSGYAELQRTVTRSTGKPMTVFQGRYQGSSFSVGSGYVPNY